VSDRATLIIVDNLFNPLIPIFQESESGTDDVMSDIWTLFISGRLMYVVILKT